MKHLFVFCFLLVLGEARGIAGAWERVLFWRCYLLEVSITKGRTNIFAKGCKGTAIGGSCNINEFIQYINNMPNRPNLILQWKSDIELANAINKGYTKGTKDVNVLTSAPNDYARMRILEAIAEINGEKKRISQSMLFESIIERTQGIWKTIKSPTDAQKNSMVAIDYSLTNIFQHRSKEWGDIFISTLQKYGKQPVLRTVFIGGTKYDNVLDLGATISKYGKAEIENLIDVHHTRNNTDKKNGHYGHWVIAEGAQRALDTLRSCEYPKVLRKDLSWVRRWLDVFAGAVDHAVELSSRVSVQFAEFIPPVFLQRG